MPTSTSSTPQSSSSAPTDPYAHTSIGAQPLTHASFSPASSTYSPTLFKQQQTIIVHQKSPLLLATPPQITRALSYSHPFLLPLNKLVGLLSWTTEDPWESFLLVAGFWAITIYGDQIIRFAGPVLVVIALIMGMYSRRYSPLSSSWSSSADKPSKHRRGESEANNTPHAATSKDSTTSVTRHQKSLDEVVDTLRVFTSRCNILLDPFLRLTDFLSTQRTATTSSTRASLMTLFIRIVLVTPLWYLLTLRPLYIITTRRVILTFGTIVLSWHSRPARVARAILWRSRFVRRTVSLLTGLSFSDSSGPNAAQSAAAAAAAAAAAKYKSGKSKSNPLLVAAQKEGVRFTFSLWENQRRWLGIGWTTSMLAYERPAWTDEELNPAPPKDKFVLPEVEGGVARWRWIEGSRWTLEGVDDVRDNDDEDDDSDEVESKTDTYGTSAADENSKPQLNSAASKNQNDSDKMSIKTTASKASDTGKKSSSASKNKGYSDDGGWIYYDTKWRFPRRGVDGWGKYTRRRKWLRDAELVEITPASTPSVEQAPVLPQTPTKGATSAASSQPMQKQGSKQEHAQDDASTTGSKPRTGGGGGWFSRSRNSSKASTTSSASGSSTVVEGGAADNGSFSLSVHEKDRLDTDDDGFVPMPFRGRQAPLDRDWAVGEDAAMELG